MASVVCLNLNMPEEDILEHNNAKCQVCIILVDL